jgi:hypothetical protein
MFLRNLTFLLDPRIIHSSDDDQPYANADVQWNSIYVLDISSLTNSFLLVLWNLCSSLWNRLAVSGTTLLGLQTLGYVVPT